MISHAANFIMHDLSAPAASLWLAAIASLATALFLAFALRNRLKPAQICLCGLALFPLAAVLTAITVFHIRNAMPFTGYPLTTNWGVMVFVVAPNFLISFLIAAGHIIRSKRKNQDWGTRSVCATVMVVQALGLWWAYIFLTYEGRL
jgi:hypothetical protein